MTTQDQMARLREELQRGGLLASTPEFSEALAIIDQLLGEVAERNATREEIEKETELYALRLDYCI